MMLRGGSLSLLLALTVVSVVLIYFVKKKVWITHLHTLIQYKYKYTQIATNFSFF